MVLIFHVPPLASEQGHCYIDRVKREVPQKNFRKMESSDTAKLDR